MGGCLPPSLLCPFSPTRPVLLLLGPPLSLGGRRGHREEGLEPSPHPCFPPSSYATDDDIVFEDFARLRLKGMKDEDYEDQFC